MGADGLKNIIPPNPYAPTLSHLDLTVVVNSLMVCGEIATFFHKTTQDDMNNIFSYKINKSLQTENWQKLMDLQKYI